MATQSPFDHGQETSNTPTLDAFISAAKAAGDGGEVKVCIDGKKYLVLATGRTASGREVSWIANAEPDATSIYVAAFQKHFGKRLTEAVVGHFANELKPGKPLAARTVTLALEMADRSLTVLSGVDFLTKLHSSAIARGRNFDETCQKLGIDPANISQQARVRIDAEIQQRFQSAYANAETPVPIDHLQQWLHEAISKEAASPEA